MMSPFFLYHSQIPITVKEDSLRRLFKDGLVMYFSHILKLRKEIFALKALGSLLNCCELKKLLIIFFSIWLGEFYFWKCQSHIFILGAGLQVSGNVILLVKLICQSLVPKINSMFWACDQEGHWRSYLLSRVLHLLWVLFLFLALLS